MQTDLPTRTQNGYRCANLECRVNPLSPREAQLMLLEATGNTVRESAELMGIKYRSAVKLKENIYFKLNVRRASHAVATAIAMGLLRNLAILLLFFAATQLDHPRPRNIGRPIPRCASSIRLMRRLDEIV